MTGESTGCLKEANSKLLCEAKSPLIQDALALGGSAAKIYLFLYEAARMDTCRKIYNSNNWIVRGISGELGMCNKTVGEEDSSNGSRNTVWGVAHPDWIENVRYAICVMGGLPSTRLKKMRTKEKRLMSPNSCNKSATQDG
ncbi:hypothetical protein RS9916_25899 [Synechococcus sp. RS9916]|nr:hypothetical protein RS9916_25899 [Synechococcus sp. RS9916]